MRCRSAARGEVTAALPETMNASAIAIGKIDIADMPIDSACNPSGFFAERLRHADGVGQRDGHAAITTASNAPSASVVLESIGVSTTLNPDEDLPLMLTKAA